MFQRQVIPALRSSMLCFPVVRKYKAHALCPQSGQGGLYVLPRHCAARFHVEAFWMFPVSPLVEHPIHMILFVLSASQVQEAASRGLKFVSVIPQYHCPVNSADSSSPVWDGDKNPGAPARADGSPEPNQGPEGETPITAQQPSLPLEEGDSAYFSKTVDGPEVDLYQVPGEPPSGSKYVGAGTIGPRKERPTASQESPWHFTKNKWNESVESALHQTGESL